MTNPTLSIVIPAYKEEARIGKTLASIASYFEGNPLSFEVIVVDDGSPDATGKVARAYASKIERLTVLTNEVNRGKGYSVQRGMLVATGEYRLFMDADSSVDISHLDSFIAAIRQGFDVAIGSIHLSDSTHVAEHNGWHRRILGASANLLVQLLATPGIADTQRGFKLFSAKAANAIFPHQTIERFGFDIELLVIARAYGLKIKELSVVWDNPAGSTVTGAAYLKTLTELGRIFVNRLAGRYTPEVQTALAQNAAYLREMTPIMHGQSQVGFTYKGAEFVHHANVHILESAFFNLLHLQKIWVGVFFGFLLFALFMNWQVTLIGFFGTITTLYFLDLLFSAFIIFRSYKGLPEHQVSEAEVKALSDEDCPTYTIFCPLYKEWHVVPQFVEAMQKLDYPHHKLQVLFLLEENDIETIEKIHNAGLPPHFQIVVVPHSKPKTKPKAMNYGLNYASGEYIVIYDAEDVPEPDQLKKAVVAFTKVAKNVACIQAKLNFYNPRQNLLTRLFTAEYSLWFDLILPGYQSIGAPIPLGGTSNHFRAPVLRELGGWDAFNVTEDCDLGMRLAKRGYATAIVDSTTHEEANSDLLNWYNQRSRWIKGYIQTYFVHMRNPKKYFAKGNARDFFLFQLIVGGKILSLFVNPIMWVTTICYFAFRAELGPAIEALFPGPILYIGVFSLIFGNFLYVYYYMVGCVKRGYDGLIKFMFLIPLYWLGMSIAAWKALYEVIVKPHYWSKTVHGLHLAPTAAALPQAPKVAFDLSVVLKNQPPRVVPVEAAVPFETRTANNTATAGAQVMPYNEPELIQILNENPQALQESWLTPVRKFIVSSAGLLVISSVIANVINFAFNAYLGRVLTLAEFGTVTIVNVFVYLLTLFTGALGSTATHEVSFSEGTSRGLGSFFYKKTWRYVLVVGGATCVAWLVAVPTISAFFNISEAIVLAFTPAIILGALAALNRGYLQGTFNFTATAVTNLSEVVIKLGLAIVLVSFGLSAFAWLAIPSSMVAAWVVSSVLVWVAYHKTTEARARQEARTVFPLDFYFAALIGGVSVAAFLTSDVLLAKHYLSPDDAGRYALLSLVGKMIFFFGSLLNTFIMPVVSRALGEGRDGKSEFARLFGGAAFLTLGATAGLAFGGFYFVPLLLGANALSIVSYVPLYAFAIGLFTLSSTVVAYGLAQKRYVFPSISFLVSVALWVGIVQNHASIQDFVTTIVTVNLLGFALTCLAYLMYDKLVYVGRNLQDLVRLFKKLPHATPAAPGKMRILIYNWRDSESVFAGGAETYIHALADRWVKAGHSVTLFTSNDGHQNPDGTIHGVRVIRRGGFFAVYALAPLYYLFKLRGQFDLIIDCENGIPFFTPLYARVPVYCLLHHIHQEVFRKALVWPFSLLALSLEKHLMPLVYRHASFITVSESSKHDMQELGITSGTIEVVYPGVDLSLLSPGTKSPTPLVAYVGRLKEYKSVDVLIRAFALVYANVPETKLVIAGDGDDLKRLKKVVAELKLQKQVSFLGKVSEAKKVEVLQSAWVTVNPSMMEGWGITVIEANACGTPVVASDVPGLRDSVQHGRTGVLTPYGDADLLADHLTHLIQDAPLRETLASDALVWAQNFGWQKSAEKFISIVSRNTSFATERNVSFAQNN